MAIVTRIRKSGPVYFVANKHNGAPAWERVGSDRREALRRDAAMKKEIKAGVYVGKPTGAKTVGAYARDWLEAREHRTAKDDKGRWKQVVKRCPWFVRMKLEDWRVAHTVKLLKELRAPYVNRHGKTKTLTPGSIYNIYGAILRPMCRSARAAELMIRDACDLEEKDRPSRATKRRKPYDAGTVVAMTTDARIDLDWRMFVTLLFYTGCRVGEVCGLRFSDWDPEAQPLGALSVTKQYNGLKLKTDIQVDGDHSRWIPVHPFLAAALDEWQRTGFELVFCRKPTRDDFIVPRRSDSRRNHSKSSAYEMFQAGLARLAIANQTVHATRNTFITLCRRAGARTDVLERVTHNAAGAVIDIYTDFDWQPLCEAVSCFMTKLPTTPQRQPVRHLHAV